MLPIRCYTCGKVIANLQQAWDEYRKDMSLSGKEEEEWLPFFETHSIRRYCCKRVLMTQTPDPNHTTQYKLPASVTVSAPPDNSKRLFIAR
jgi:DNA-directed RNA polymerase subunit N (RpoN/RPB10)